MKNPILLFYLLLGIAVQAQIKIGDNPQNIDPSSVLELESTSRVLVITRVNTGQMNAITPSAGALVYNTDAQCLYYYNGSAWTNICDAVAGSLSFTAGDETIVITPTNNTYEIIVGQINGDNIVDMTIHGTKLYNASISEHKYGLSSVAERHLQEGAVTASKINSDVVGTGLLQEASGALSIDPASITGNGDITSGTLTVGGDVNALLGDVTIEITDDAITSARIFDGTIENADISGGAAIDGSKIVPNFTENIITTAGLSVGADILLNGNTVVPDYVFQKYFQGYSKLNDTYNFKSLSEIEAFVMKNHHLPGIKSAKEVKKDGFWNLSRSNLQNLEKIEELFLYTIEQEKKIDRLKKENESLSSELKSMKKDLEDIKSLLIKSNQETYRKSRN